ncbi:hypothetical protein HDU97_008981 [Phlyctochytrium planicorne]|nr:hypothetical protein HDU97_008981 [Phlyctochytrium planicorne]
MKQNNIDFPTSVTQDTIFSKLCYLFDLTPDLTVVSKVEACIQADPQCIQDFLKNPPNVDPEAACKVLKGLAGLPTGTSGGVVAPTGGVAVGTASTTGAAKPSGGERTVVSVVGIVSALSVAALFY